MATEVLPTVPANVCGSGRNTSPTAERATPSSEAEQLGGSVPRDWQLVEVAGVKQTWN